MQRKLYRSRKFRVIGGVASGLAEYFSLDPVLMRVIFVVISLMHGIGILLYIILWIVIPEEPFEVAYQIKPEDTSQSSSSEKTIEELARSHNGKGRTIIGIILIVVGLLFLAERLIPTFCYEDILPITLIIIGAVLIWNSVRK